MAEFVKLDVSKLEKIRDVDSRLVSYNIEMTEITGGTFWTAYTDAQVDGTEEFPVITDWRNLRNLQQWYDPINLYDPKLRKLAKELGTAWIRVSGTWANKTYYVFDGHTGGQVPEGFQNLLTKEQWIGVLDFIKAVDGKLLISVANCPGIHAANEPWTPEQAELIFSFSKEYGVPISASEFTHEPNVLSVSGLPVGYIAADHARDHDLFGAWLKENYPDCLFVGPCSVTDIPMDMNGHDLVAVICDATTEELLDGCKVPLDHFTCHYYLGVSERGAAAGGHWPQEEALCEPYLKLAGNCAREYVRRRDRFAPGGQLWVTESAGGSAGGNTWDATYLDVPRTLNELGEFGTITDGIIFHNTLASAGYGWLEHGSFEPRPNYFAVLLWNRLMGNTVYATDEKLREGARVYVQSRKDGKEGVVYLIINNSWTDTTTVELPKEAEVYALTGNGKIRSRTMLLNGRELVLGENNELPELTGKPVTGTLEIAPGGCTFIVL